MPTKCPICWNHHDVSPLCRTPPSSACRGDRNRRQPAWKQIDRRTLERDRRIRLPTATAAASSSSVASSPAGAPCAYRLYRRWPFLIHRLTGEGRERVRELERLPYLCPQASLVTRYDHNQVADSTIHTAGYHKISASSLQLSNERVLSGPTTRRSHYALSSFCSSVCASVRPVLAWNK